MPKMQIGFSLSLYPPNNTSKSFKIPSFISSISKSRTWTVHGGLNRLRGRASDYGFEGLNLEHVCITLN